MACRNGFGIENIQRGTAEMPALQGCRERFGIDQIAPTHIDQDSARFELRQCVAVYEPARLRCGRAMQREDVRLLQHFVERCRLRAVLFDVCGRNDRVEDAHLALESHKPFYDLAADAPEPDHANRQVAQGLHAGQRGGQPPMAGPQMNCVGDDLASGSQYEGQSLISDFVDAIVRHVAHRNASRPRNFEVDVVHSDSVADNGTRFLHGCYNIRVHPRELCDHRIGVSAEADQVRLGFALARGEFQIVRLKNRFLHAEVGEGPISDDNPGSFWFHGLEAMIEEGSAAGETR